MTPSEGAAVSVPTSALYRAEECLTALLGATRVCVVAERVNKQVAEPKQPGEHKRRSKRVPTSDFMVALFEGGRIACPTKQQAEQIARSLSEAVQSVLLPVKKALIEELRTELAMKANISDGKRSIAQVKAAQLLTLFHYNAVEAAEGYMVVPSPNALATVPGTDDMMEKLSVSLNTAIKRITTPICEKLKKDCATALDQALEECPTGSKRT